EAGGEVTPKNFGSTLFIPVDGEFIEANDNVEATVVEAPGCAGESGKGTDAVANAADPHLTLPIEVLIGNLSGECLRYMVNTTLDRGGILTVSPPMNGADNNLSAGFRLFREGSATEPRIKLHIGTDAGDVWNDGDIIEVNGEWVHIAFTVSDTETLIYVDGEAVANTGNMTDKTINWADCEILSIGSGAPNFIGWNHLSDLSYMDDLYLFDR